MEYNPIAINEAMAYQAQYGVTDSNRLTTYQAMFIELVNTLTEEQNNTGRQQRVGDLAGRLGHRRRPGQLRLGPPRPDLRRRQPDRLAAPGRP